MNREARETGIVFIVAGAAVLLLLLCGCTVNITSSGEHATFELSPARNIYPDTSVMNGFSLLPGSGETENSREKSAE